MNFPTSRFGLARQARDRKENVGQPGGRDESRPCISGLDCGRGLFPFILAFDDGDVAIDGKIGETLDESARLGPFDFESVEFFVFAEAENDARVVRREIAAAAYLEARLPQI